jgi:hypothetical protein
METTDEQLHLDKWSLVLQKIKDMPTRFIWIINLFGEALKYGDGAKLLGYFGANVKPLSVEFSNCVHIHVFINHFTCYTMWGK